MKAEPCSTALRRKFAEGWTADLYETEDPTQLLKLYKPAFRSLCDLEHRKMRLLQEVSALLPRVHSQVEIDGRAGYLLDRIHGAPLSSLDLEPGELAVHLLRVHALVRSCPVGPSIGSLRERLLERMPATSAVSGKLRLACTAYLEQDKPPAVLCHGDFHPGNILSAEGRDYLVDWNGACLGPPEADIAKTIVLVLVAPEGLALRGHLYGQRRQLASQLYELVTKDSQLRPGALDAWLLLRLCEFMGFPLPEFHRTIRPWLDGVEAPELFDARSVLGFARPGRVRS